MLVATGWSHHAGKRQTRRTSPVPHQVASQVSVPSHAEPWMPRNDARAGLEVTDIVDGPHMGPLPWLPSRGAFFDASQLVRV